MARGMLLLFALFAALLLSGCVAAKSGDFIGTLPMGRRPHGCRAAFASRRMPSLSPPPRYTTPETSVFCPESSSTVRSARVRSFPLRAGAGAALTVLLCLLLAACGTAKAPETSAVPVIPEETSTEEISMKLFINETEVPVTWEENNSVAALRDLALGDGLTVSMSMYGGFEQVGSIGQRIPREDRQTTTEAGDIVLYSGNQIVVFYGSNSWAYTRLGHVELSPSEMTKLLANGDVTLRILEG